METNETGIAETNGTAKDIFKAKTRILVERPHLLGLSQAKFNGRPPQKKQGGLLEFSRIFFSRLSGLSSDDY